MDREGQLRNVAFGGAWSEQIVGDDALALAMRAVEGGAQRTRHEDLRQANDVIEAVEIVCAAHPKGALLSEAWTRALNVSNRGLRARELARIASVIREGLGERAGARIEKP